MEVIVVLELEGLKDKEGFEKHIKREGFELVEGEQFAYTGNSSTSTFSTKAYILEVFKKGLQKSGFDNCNMIFNIEGLPWQAYKYDFNTNDFEQVKE